MATVNIRLADAGPLWVTACKQTVQDRNSVFKRSGIAVTLVVGGPGPIVTVRTDPGIQGTALHGQTRAETDSAGNLLRADVRLPVKLIINTPTGIRDAGAGVAEVIAAHEFVHALRHAPHNSHLMTRTLTKISGDRPAGDKVKAGAILMPPLHLSNESVKILKGMWP
jgi:hypothetical protein